METLLTRGADIDETGADGTTPLCAAALWGNERMITFLLEKGASIDAPNSGRFGVLSPFRLFEQF